MQLKRSAAFVLALATLVLFASRTEAGWLAVTPMPHEQLDKPIGPGAWMATLGDEIYIAKGNKTKELYKYYPEGDSWVKTSGLPDTDPVSGKVKLAGKGTDAVSDGVQSLYMVHGNGTYGFWRYSTGEWETLPRVPVKLKGGNDMVYVKGNKDATDKIFLLAGGKTAFYCYDVGTGTWTQKESVPYGLNKKKYAAGSFLVYDGENTIYAHQGKLVDEADSSHFMFRYDLAGDSWVKTKAKGLPWFGLEKEKSKKKKSGDGAAAVAIDGQIYAWKGGGSQAFYRYYANGDSWHQLDPLPLGELNKPVKAGGALAVFNGKIYGVKGNKTFELWKYEQSFASRPGSPAVQAGVLSRTQSFSIAPNPLASGFATLRFGRNLTGPASVKVYDALGRVVMVRSLPAASGVTLDVRELAAGVYLVCAEAKGYSAAQRLVVQK